MSRFEHSGVFYYTLLSTILFASVMVGLESEPSFNTQESFVGFEVASNVAVQAVFTMEVAVKVIACGASPWEYFLVIDWSTLRDAGSAREERVLRGRGPPRRLRCSRSGRRG